MQKMITAENIRNFAYVNENLCKKPIRGIVLSFFGLGTCVMYDKDIIEGEICAEKGYLYAAPYTNPWSWMNAQAVAYADEVVDVLMEKYGLSEDIPIISTGGSMGGQSALVYCVYSRRTPKACVVDCPVCDAVYHITERKDLPRTFYSALYDQNCTLDEALKSISPLHLVQKLPRIPYHILHCETDTLVSPEAHSKRFAKALEENGNSVTLDIVGGRGHCDLSLEGRRKFWGYVFENAD